MAAVSIADTTCKLDGILTIGPSIGITRFLQQSRVFFETLFQRVEVFEKSIDSVIPAVAGLTLGHRNDTFWCCELPVWRIEILMREN